MEIVQLLLPSGSFSHVPDLSNELTKPIDRSIDLSADRLSNRYYAEIATYIYIEYI